MMDDHNAIELGLSRLQTKFLSMKTNDILTDATVICHGVVIKAHKCILSVNSSYFKSVFSKYLNENVQVDCSEQTSDIDQFGSIIDFMYTGNIYVTEENIAELVGLGAFFGIDDLVYICVKYIRQSLNQDNCLQIYLNLHNARLNCEGPITLTSLSSEVNLGNKVWKMVEGGFHDYIIHQEYMLQVSTEDMEHLLQKDITKQCSVEGVLSLADRWLQAHPDMEGVEIIQKLLPLAVDKAESLMFSVKDSAEILTCRDNMAAVLAEISTDTQFSQQILSYIYTVLDLRDKNILIGDSVYTSFLTGNEAFDDVPDNVNTSVSVYNLDEFGEMNEQPGISSAVISDAATVTGNEMETADVTMVNEDNTSTMLFQCSVCFRLFQQKSYLETHMAEHSAEIQCRKCFQKFDSTLKLEAHVCSSNDWNVEVIPVNTESGTDGETPANNQTSTDSQMGTTVTIPVVTHVTEVTHSQLGVDSHPSIVAELLDSDTTQKKRGSLDRPFVCGICGKSFKRKDHLGIHTRGHTGELPYPCPECDERFRMRKYLNIHMLKHTYVIGDSIGCDICHVSCGSTQQAEMGIHMRQHMAPMERTRNWKCQECGVIFPKKIMLKAHLQKHSGGRTCLWCKKQFSTRSELVIHRKKCTSERVFHCAHCDKKFQVRAILKKHIAQVHVTDRKYICEICNKAFVDKYNLHRHRTIHTEELPYKCNDCEKSFKHKSGLIRHARLDHNDGNRFTCEKCHMVFADSYDLKRHDKLHQGNTPFKCDICEDAQFTKSSGLKHHLRRIHKITDVSLSPGNVRHGSFFKCEQCSEEFTCKSLKVKHVKDKHGNKLNKKKLHPCGLCKEAFTEQSDLILHVQMHVFDSPYNCGICGKPFEEEIKMQKHYDSHSVKISCAFCEAVYNSKSGYDGHLKKVHPEVARPVKELVHQCAECGEKFPDNKILLAHIRTHFAVTMQNEENETLTDADAEQRELLKEIVDDVNNLDEDDEKYDKIIYIEMSDNFVDTNSAKVVNQSGKKSLNVSKQLTKSEKKSDDQIPGKQRKRREKQLKTLGKKTKKEVAKSLKVSAKVDNIRENTHKMVTKQFGSVRLVNKPKTAKSPVVRSNNVSAKPFRSKKKAISKKPYKGTTVSAYPAEGLVEVKIEPVDSCANTGVEPLDSPTTRRASSRRRLKKVIVDV